MNKTINYSINSNKTINYSVSKINSNKIGKDYNMMTKTDTYTLNEKEIESKEHLNEYIIRFSITLLNRSENINNLIDLPKNYNNKNIVTNWEYISNQFKTLNVEKELIKKDILRLICHDNFKSITNNFKGIDIRYLITKKIIDECYVYL